MKHNKKWELPYWQVTNRKSWGWIDLMVSSRGRIIYLDFPYLDQPICRITEEQVAYVLAAAGQHTGDAARLHQELHSHITKKADKTLAELWVAFVYNTEDDPGLGSVSTHFLAGKCYEVKKRLEDRFSSEFHGYSLISAKSLQLQLKEKLSTSLDDIQKQWNQSRPQRYPK